MIFIVDVPRDPILSLQKYRVNFFLAEHVLVDHSFLVLDFNLLEGTLFIDFMNVLLSLLHQLSSHIFDVSFFRILLDFTTDLRIFWK